MTDNVQREIDDLKRKNEEWRIQNEEIISKHKVSTMNILPFRMKYQN